MYCGVLPYIVSDGNIYLLLGFEPRGLSEFGGSADCDDYRHEAIREFHEETHGIFSFLDAKLARLNDTDIIITSDTAIIYAFQLPLTMTEVLCYIQAYNGSYNLLADYGVAGYLPHHSGLMEKTRLQLFHLSDLTPAAISVSLIGLSYHFGINYPIFCSYLRQRHQSDW